MTCEGEHRDLHCASSVTCEKKNDGSNLSKCWLSLKRVKRSQMTDRREGVTSSLAYIDCTFNVWSKNFTLLLMISGYVKHGISYNFTVALSSVLHYWHARLTRDTLGFIRNTPFSHFMKFMINYCISSRWVNYLANILLHVLLMTKRLIFSAP